MKRRRLILVATACTAMTLAIESKAESTDVFSVVLRVDGEWGLHLGDGTAANLEHVKTEGEPRSPAVCAKARRVAYISSGGSLREITLDGTKVASDRVLLAPTPDVGYAQPAYDEDCNRLFVVVLKQGKSVDTDISEVIDGRLDPVVSQRSAQFEPFHGPDGWLYYANVSCFVGCANIIQEVWRMHLLSGVAEQLTLTNAIAREPVVSAFGQKIYFSSNRAGHYHIWEFDRPSAKYVQLTHGDVVDSSPAEDSQGSIFFVRQSQAGFELLTTTKDGESSDAVKLPPGVVGIRDLKISTW